MEISELKNQTILITGAAGSIGRELVLGLAQYQPKRLILVDISELGMHSLLQEMAIHFPQVKLNYYLESICDTAFISALFQKQHIDIVFHAAAYKHVSLMEENVCAAVIFLSRRYKHYVHFLVIFHYNISIYLDHHSKIFCNIEESSKSQ